MDNSFTPNNQIIVLHSVLIGLTPLIPIPVVDDLAKTYLQRRLTRKLGQAYNRNFSDAEVKVLSDAEDSGCLAGCLTTILIYPLKKIFRKIFFFLEWKRAIDSVSHYYHHGYLLDYAMYKDWCAPESIHPTAKVREALDEVIEKTSIKPIETAVRKVFDQSKSVLKAAAKLLQKPLQNLEKRDETAIAQAVERVEAEEEKSLLSVTNKLRELLEAIPDSHFEGMRSKMDTFFNSLK